MCPAFEGNQAPLRTRPGTGSAIFLVSLAKAYPRHSSDRDRCFEKLSITPTKNVDTHTRNPLLLFLLFGLLWLR